MTRIAKWQNSRYELPYDDGVHEMQTYISDDGQEWSLIGYDGVLRDIADDDPFFFGSRIVLEGGPRPT